LADPSPPSRAIRVASVLLLGGACLMAIAAALREAREAPVYARAPRLLKVLEDHGPAVLAFNRAASLIDEHDAVALAPPHQWTLWRYFLMPRPVYILPGDTPTRAERAPAFIRSHRRFLESKKVRWVVWLRIIDGLVVPHRSRLVDVHAVLAGSQDPGVLLRDETRGPPEPTRLHYLGAAGVVLLMFALGWALWPAVSRDGGPASWQERLPRIFALGLLVQYALLSWVVLLGLGLTRALHLGVLLAALVVLVAGRLLVFRPRGPAPSTTAPAPERRTPLRLACIALCVFMVLAVTVRAMVMPIRNMDALNFWGLTAKTLHHEGGVRNGMYLDPDRGHTFRSYPLLVPLTLSSMYAALGSPEDQAAKIVFPVFCAMIILAAYGALRRERPGAGALMVTTSLACCFTYLDYEGGAVSALTDVPLSLFILLGLVEWRRWAATRERAALCQWILYLSAAAVTKTEGTFILAAAMAAALAVSRGTRPVAWTRLALGAAAVALLVAPWYLFAASLPAGAGAAPPRPLLETMATNLPQWATQIPVFFAETLHTNRWGVLWLLAAGSIVTGWRRAPRPHRLVAGLVLCQFAAYILAYLALPTNQADIVATTKKRLLYHLAPSAAYLAWCFLHWAPDSLRERDGEKT